MENAWTSNKAKWKKDEVLYRQSVSVYAKYLKLNRVSFVSNWIRNRTSCGYREGSRARNVLTEVDPRLATYPQRKPYRFLIGNRISSCGFIAFLFG